MTVARPASSHDCQFIQLVLISAHFTSIRRRVTARIIMSTLKIRAAKRARCQSAGTTISATPPAAIRAVPICVALSLATRNVVPRRYQVRRRHRCVNVAVVDVVGRHRRYVPTGLRYKHTQTRARALCRGRPVDRLALSCDRLRTQSNSAASRCFGHATAAAATSSERLGDRAMNDGM